MLKANKYAEKKPKEFASRTPLDAISAVSKGAWAKVKLSAQGKNRGITYAQYVRSVWGKNKIKLSYSSSVFNSTSIIAEMDTNPQLSWPIISEVDTDILRTELLILSSLAEQEKQLNLSATNRDVNLLTIGDIEILSSEICKAELWITRTWVSKHVNHVMLRIPDKQLATYIWDSEKGLAKNNIIETFQQNSSFLEKSPVPASTTEISSPSSAASGTSLATLPVSLLIPEVTDATGCIHTTV
ncbi:hypothetical protein [Pelagibaculum spongiae]|uniref:Uncharacterized protein n=1 Tax=Pelagibaculum spongiae TaxID=2080658 RepID=A0A2V1GXW2_9GAMM|nr:hypothetical protein [Pelagibaculum spongiae]PVZ66352.1 hypothetical protein DC094_16780 [Pelagibaculum spongiae]